MSSCDKMVNLRELDTVERFSAISCKGDNSVTSPDCFPADPIIFEESTQKGKNLLPWGANSSLLE